MAKKRLTLISPSGIVTVGFVADAEYLKVISIPENDALHTAIATVYNWDILLSWNFVHSVNYQNRVKINGINLINGYRETSIFSPYEL